MKISEVVALPPLQKSNIDCEPPDLPHRFKISIRMVMALTENLNFEEISACMRGQYNS